MSKKERIDATEVTESHIKTHDVRGLGIKVKDSPVTGVCVVDRDPETKKQLAEQRCQVSGSKSRYLFEIERKDGSKMLVKASVIEAAGVTRKEIDRLYSVGYYADKPASAKTRLSKEQQTEALDAFLSA